MGPKNWVWDYFYTDKEHHGKNQTAYNAWCNACIENEMAILRNIDIRAAATGIAAARTENQQITSPTKGGWCQVSCRKAKTAYAAASYKLQTCCPTALRSPSGGYSSDSWPFSYAVIFSRKFFEFFQFESGNSGSYPNFGKTYKETEDVKL